MIPPEMALSPLVGLLQSPQILMAVSLDHPIKNARKIFDKRVKVRRLRQRKRQKSDFEKKKLCDYFLFSEGGGGQNQLLPYPFYSPDPDNCYYLLNRLNRLCNTCI